MKPQLYFYPDYSGGNPYQRLLYAPTKEVGWGVYPGDIKLALQKCEQMSPVVFHMHWLNALFANCESNESAWHATDEFIANVSRFKELNGKVIWTVHNHVPHEGKFMAQDSRVRYFLSSVADAVHLHCNSHIEELSELFFDPRKVKILRHGHYIGAYGNFDIYKRMKATQTEKPKVLFLGALRKNKSIDSLIYILKAFAESGMDVTIAGMPQDSSVREKIEASLKGHNFNKILRRLTESEVHNLCLEHNIGVLSYSQILTSGTLKLYQSYGMALVSPRLNSIEIEDRYKNFFYYGDDNESMKETVDRVCGTSPVALSQISYKNYLAASECVWSHELFKIMQTRT